MSFRGKVFTAALGAGMLTGTATMLFAAGLVASRAEAHETPVSLAAPAAAEAPARPLQALEASIPEAEAATDGAATAPPLAAPATAEAESPVDGELLCLAKIVLHEAGNQPRDGQLAVAQVVMNRLASPRFPKTICGIALQPGQFFNVHAYNPPRNARWDRALEVARDARSAASPPVVADAVFFHAAYARPAFFRTRQRVARLGGHVFYR